jgi:hypothetical protein
VGREPRLCVFCGAIADSREHLFPEWLQGLFDDPEPIVYVRQIGSEQLRFPRRRFSERTRCVCTNCNHGWLSRLEEATKPVLTPAITRTAPLALDLGRQRIAARWATKTTYVFQTLGPELLTRPINPHLLRMNLRPPPEVSVFLGSHYRALSDPANSLYIQKPLWAELEGDTGQAFFGYVAFIAVGGVSFLVAEHRIGRYVEVVLGPMFNELFTKIWPHASRVASWPPPLQMDSELLDGLFLESVPPSFDARAFDLPAHAMVLAADRAAHGEDW